MKEAHSLLERSEELREGKATREGQQLQFELLGRYQWAMTLTGI